jgi:hypothetical protein
MITLGANRWWFYTFDLEICFAQRNVALFLHSNFVEFYAFDLYMGFVLHAPAFRRSVRTSLDPLTPFPATKPCKNNVFP